MQGIEKTLRNALARMDNPDAPAREKLFKSTRAILERSLEQYSQTQPELVTKRREEINEIIARIEAEYKEPDILFDQPDRPNIPVRDQNTAPRPMPDQPAPIMSDFEEQASTPPIFEPQPPSSEPIDQAAASEPSLGSLDTVAPQKSPDHQKEHAIFFSNVKRGTDGGDKDEEPVFRNFAEERKKAEERERAERAAAQEAAKQEAARLEAEKQAQLGEIGAQRRELEQEFGTAPAIEVGESTTSSDAAQKVHAPNPVQNMRQHLERQHEIQNEQDANEKPGETNDIDQMRREKRRHRRKIADRIAGLIVIAILFILLFLGASAFYNSQYFALFEEWRTGEPAETVVAEPVDPRNFEPKPINEDAQSLKDWAALFTIDDANQIRGRGDVSVTMAAGEGQNSVRIISASAGKEGEALIPLNTRELALNPLQNISIALTMRAPDDATEIYVKPLLTGNDDGKRYRFQISPSRSEIIIYLDKSELTALKSSAYLAINSDIGGTGKSVDLFDIRYQVTRPAN